MKKYALGVDIGGGHITVAAIDLEEARIVPGTSIRKEVKAQGDAGSILSAWTDAITSTIAKAGETEERIPREAILGVGVAMPGPFDYENGISLINDPEQNKFLSLYKMNIRQELAGRTGFTPDKIRFRNDAECFLLGEVFVMDIKKDKNIIGVTLGTGFGSAWRVDGKVADANLWCAPFRNGVAEDYISTRWFVRRYKELTGKDIAGVKELADVITVDSVACQLFNEFGLTLGEFLTPYMLKNQIDTLIAGGNIAMSLELFAMSLEKELTKSIPSIRILKAVLGEDAHLIGGASLFDT